MASHNRVSHLAGELFRTSGIGRTPSLMTLIPTTVKCWRVKHLGGRRWLRDYTRKKVDSTYADGVLDYMRCIITVSCPVDLYIMKSFSSRCASPFPFTVPLCFRSQAQRRARSASSCPSSIRSTYSPRMGRNFHPWKEPAVAT